MSTNQKIVVWNCRGAANKAFFRYCKQYIDRHKPCMLVIVEKRCDPLKLHKSFMRLGFDSMESVDNSGFARGIIIAWKSWELNVQLCDKDEQFLHTKINIDRNCTWNFTAIYARPNEVSKKKLWEDLEKLAQNINDPWMVAGDFNDIAHVTEKKGGVQASSQRCGRMRGRMDNCNLSDLEARGPKFTWRGPVFHGGQRIYEKLDRAITNDEWRLKFPDSFVKVLTRVEFSDHHPILISLYEECYSYQQRPFRFETAWIMNETYVNMLHDSWKEDNSIINNLKNVVDGIENWKFNSFDQIKRIKSALIRRLNGVQHKLQLHDNRGGMRRLEVKLQGELSNILNQEELMWY
ncbi:uncharacterized protein LOC131636243 [Vicia villosa]|uniref:uncharacterized protein LOC131636243 n=1 Tax=Vicia villosa TaxID=3911 RepID=UPI00273C9774|nr:uncharacterized protein LOC131636243 [Vicia villosa]